MGPFVVFLGEVEIASVRCNDVPLFVVGVKVELDGVVGWVEDMVCPLMKVGAGRWCGRRFV